MPRPHLRKSTELFLEMSSDHCQVYGALRPVLQGDQLGVEFGIAAHVGLLLEKGALSEEHMLRADRLPRPRGLFQGLGAIFQLEESPREFFQPRV